MIRNLHFSDNLDKHIFCTQIRNCLGLVLLTILFLPSCNITKFLDEDDRIVDDTGMEISSYEKSSDISELKAELEKFSKVKPNKNGRSRNYFKYKDLENPSWIKRWLFNKHSEPPSLLDSLKINEGVSNIQNYLRNKKGYYQADVEYEVKTLSPHKVKVNYLINTGNRYKINKLYHISKDSSLVSLLDDISKGSIIKDSDPIDAFAFDIEKQRIVSEFQKRGYADFNLTHVEIKGDSTELENGWDIFMMVIPPSDAQHHKKFSIGDINVYTDFHQNQKESDVNTEYILGKYYKHQSSDFIVRPTTIDRKIFFSKYDTYDSEKYYKTIRNLFSLGSYRFAKLNPKVNPSDSSLIDYNIFLTPYDRKWSMDTGLEAFYSNYSNISIVNSNNLIGMAAHVGLEDKNTFRGSEKFTTALEAGVEVNPSDFSLNTLALGLNNKLQIPTLTKPFNILRPLKRLSIIKEDAYAVLQEEGKSNITLGFNYIQNINLFSRFSVKAGYGYEFILNSKHSLTFNQIGINYNLYNFEPPFLIPLSKNPVLANSFKNGLFTGFLFNDLTHYYKSERGRSHANIALISRLELSGLEVHGVNSLSNWITGKNSQWTVADIAFERLAKLEFDFRWYQRAKPHSQLAARFKTGLAVPLDRNRTVAFIKQFSVGGPSSLRAWRPMHVGPGTYLHEGHEFFNPADSTIFYQRGDIVLETSLEYRFDLVWLMEGALYVDAGNVWTIREDPLRPGAKFDTNFLSTLAVGYGYGIRFDFNYFIIRFDLGFKLRYPSIIDPATNKPVVDPETKLPVVNSRWTGPNWGKSNSQKFGNFNIAVNYPF